MKQQCLVIQQIIFGLLIFLNIFEIDGATIVSDGKKSTLNIAVIGAGYDGLLFFSYVLNCKLS